MSEIINKPTIINMWDILSKIKKEELNSRTKTIYITMHPDLIKELLMDPDLDTFLHNRVSVITTETLELAFGCQIFEESKMHRNKIKVYYETDVLLDGGKQ